MVDHANGSVLESIESLSNGVAENRLQSLQSEKPLVKGDD